MSSTHSVQPAPAGFLSLAPAVSDSYPKQQVKTTVAPPSETSSVSDAPAAHRRTSSVSSTGSQYKGLRFLKLGPVHYGEHQGDNKTDFHEAAVEE